MNAIGDPQTGLQPFELLLDQKRIVKRIAELGDRITEDYRGKRLVLIGVLKGCIVFLADLMREIQLPLQLDFVSAASYRHGSSQDKELYLERNVSIELKDRHVLLVEGIVDSGRTVHSLNESLGRMEPASLEVVTLIDKPASRRWKVDIKYRGFTVGNEFVIGYGLDNAQKYRNLPFIGRMVER